MNLLVVPLNWLSTHLIMLTLTAFAMAGYWLVVPVVGQEAAGSFARPGKPARVDAPVDPRPPPTPSAAVGDGQPAHALVEPAKVPEPPGTPAEAVVSTPPPPPPPTSPSPPPTSPSPPRLIGGTLPVYPLSGHGGRESQLIGQAFRPPTSGQLPEAAQDPRERLVQAARRAYWNNEYDASEAAYMALISRYPGDADAFGELGNLYRAMSKYDRAMDAYYEAGVRLKLAGEFEKLSIVRELLLQAQDARAAELGPG